ncbi:dicarboxylic acid transporter PcaT [Caballeronia sordidicola]|uniref:Dicarboxylic acid transporter PcaT n=1 Tax=Caballeronia sordidicola TaxID=196367 RepID=A0A242M937_CABSO|nr:dicarboxylic acid transporter PcaT [Caballeronia sordidicola]
MALPSGRGLPSVISADDLPRN